MYRAIITLSKLTHQMWHNHPFSERNEKLKRAVWGEVGGNGERGRGLGKL